MNFVTDVISPAWSIIPILERHDLSNDAKLEQLTDRVSIIVEAGDDLLAEQAPFGFREIARVAVDNPIVDGWQRTFLSRPASELIFQVWTTTGRTLDGLSEFAKRVINPTRDLIAELARTDANGEDKHALLKSNVLGILAGAASLTDLLPKSLADALAGLRSSGLFENALATLAGLIAEVLYQGWKFMHPEASALVIA
ncbi:MAG: hypothetical protein HC933_08515 [Pleurocapsa sp. SU_196_0]|nr:hypothetical protein [Pleurocapsa sp. SU_196_0]